MQSQEALKDGRVYFGKASWKRECEAGLERKKGTEGRERLRYPRLGRTAPKGHFRNRKRVVWTRGREVAWFG